MSYAALSMASLSSMILMTKDQLVTVMTSNISFDLTTMEFAVPFPPTATPMNYLQARTAPFAKFYRHSNSQQSLPTSPSRQSHSKYKALQLMIATKMTHLGPSSVSATSVTTNTTSVLTNNSLLDSLRSQQVEYPAQQDAKHNTQYYAQMEAWFERMMHQNIELEEKINNQFLMHGAQEEPLQSMVHEKKSILASDMSHQAQQLYPKHQDSKTTPTKIHPTSGVAPFQNP